MCHRDGSSGHRCDRRAIAPPTWTRCRLADSSGPRCSRWTIVLPTWTLCRRRAVPCSRATTPPCSGDRVVVGRSSSGNDNGKERVAGSFLCHQGTPCTWIDQKQRDDAIVRSHAQRCAASLFFFCKQHVQAASPDDTILQQKDSRSFTINDQMPPLTTSSLRRYSAASSLFRRS